MAELTEGSGRLISNGVNGNSIDGGKGKVDNFGRKRSSGVIVPCVYGKRSWAGACGAYPGKDRFAEKLREMGFFSQHPGGRKRR